MAIIQTEWAKGQRATPSGCSAGDVKTVEFSYTIKDGATLAAADIVELGPLVAFHQVVGAKLVNDALGGTITANVGFITGEPGSETLGTELYSAQSVAAAASTEMNSAYGLRLPSTDDNRRLGLKLSADATASGDKVITLVLQYAASSN